MAFPPAPEDTPLVLINGLCHGVPSILPDEYAGGRAATQALIDAGHRRIAYITGWPTSWATVQRTAGFHDAVAAARIPASSTTVLPGDFQVESGHQQTRRLLRRRRRPTAICYGNDMMAIGGYFAIKEAGLDIPGDISVIGYDDHDHLAEHVHPPLSTMRLPYYEMGHWAATTILEQRTGSLQPQTLVACPVVRQRIDRTASCVL